MGVLSKGTDFTNGDQVTDTSLDNLVDNATFTTSAVDEVSTDIGGTGSIIVKDGGITTGKLADSTSAATGVTSVKIATSAVTAAKIGTNAVTTAKILDDNVTTAKILDANVTTAKIADANVTFAKLTDVIDDDTMATATATNLATSESIKAYVDASGTVQRVRVSSATQHATTATMNFDDTIPLVTEGLEILTTSYTPLSASNTVSVRFDGQVSNLTAAAGMMVALFEDTVCVGACYFQQPNSGISRTSVDFEFTPAGASAATYSIRVGGSTSTTYVNRLAADAHTLGGLVETSMTIKEYAP